MKKHTNRKSGPKSMAGKAISSMNAIKHGGYSQKRLLPFEDAKAYQTHFDEVICDLSPNNSLQHVAASQYADALWRVERMQVREKLTRQEMMSKVTPQIVAEQLGFEGRKRELAPDYLVDINYEIPVDEMEGLEDFFKERYYLLQNCKGMANFNMVWRQFPVLFTHLARYVAEFEDMKPLFMASGEGLDIAWQQNPKQLLDTLEDLFYIYEYRADFEAMKPDIQTILLHWYYTSRSEVQRIDEMSTTQIRLIKECHYLLAQYWKLCKSQNEYLTLKNKQLINQKAGQLKLSSTKIPKVQTASQKNESQRNEMVKNLVETTT